MTPRLPATCVLALCIAAVIAACTRQPSPCAYYARQLAGCNDPSSLSTTLIWPGYTEEDSQAFCEGPLASEPRHRDEIGCVSAARSGDCSQIRACHSWVGRKYSSVEPEPEREPPTHYRPGDSGSPR